MVAFWQGFSLFFFALTIFRVMDRIEMLGSGQRVSTYARMALIASAAVGVLGYAGLYGNFPEQRTLSSLLLVLGAGAGVWTASRVIHRAA